MKITFCGAARMVTGSSYLLEVGETKLLVDCGMLQGEDEDKVTPFSIPPEELDFVLLTHAHIDHSGRLPLLYKQGFRGKIICTKATNDLCGIMLLDSAHIQEMEAMWKNKKSERAGKALVEPMYNIEDAKGALTLFESHNYNEMVEVNSNIKARYVDAGHLLGSASIEVWATEGGQTRKLAFSGDIGNTDQPIIKDPTYIEEADFVLVESTYGDRMHETDGNHVEELAKIITDTFSKGGNVIIPSFAVGRTQELLYLLREIMEKHLVPQHDNFPVFMDSPLAVEATEIFTRDSKDNYDDAAMQLIENHINPISFPSLQMIVEAEQSKALNTFPQPCVIISASGMCDAGRIKHHLKHNLWRKECSIVFAGYQAVGTLGRSILDGAKKVTIFGEEIEVAASIYKLGNISGHADKAGILRWLKAYKTPIKEVFVIHGEEQTALGFANLLIKDLGMNAYAPKIGESFDLLSATITQRTAVPVAAENELTSTLGQLVQLARKGDAQQTAQLKKEIQALTQKWQATLSQKADKK